MATRLLEEAGGTSIDTALVSPWVNRTERAFPGMEKLPAQAQAALISLVFNRGPGMRGRRRSEMRTIRKLVHDYSPRNGAESLTEIAGQLRNMKRLWIGKGLPGMLRRREAEAELVLSAI